MALPRTRARIVSLTALATLLGVGMAAISLGDKANATQPKPAPTPAVNVRVGYWNGDGTLKPVPYQVRYTATPGRSNTVAFTVRKAGANLVYTIDDRVDVALGDDLCGYPDDLDRTLAICTIPVFTPKQSGQPGPSLRAKLGDGNDTVKVELGAGAKVTLDFDLEAGDDTFTSSDAAWVSGGAGDDVIEAGGASQVAGDAGNDTLRVPGDLAAADGGGGDDTIMGGRGSQTLLGMDGNDVIRGGGGDDTISGDAGDDELHGDAGNDVLTGGSGNDKLVGGRGRNKLSD